MSLRTAIVSGQLLLAAGLAMAQDMSLPLPPLPQIAAEVVQEDRYPQRVTEFANGVRGYASLAYRQPVGFRPLTLDLYLPAVSTSKGSTGFPLLIFIHSGGWLGGDTRRNGVFTDFPATLAAMASRGYAVASVQYRLSGEAKFPAQAQDIKAAIRWLRLNASNFDIDPARIATWGASAGGHLAALTAVSCKVPELSPTETPSMQGMAPDTKRDSIASAKVSDCVQAGVAWNGVFDMNTIAAQARKANAMSRDVPQAPEWQLLGCGAGRSSCGMRQLRHASPVSHVDANDPPMLLIAGDQDKTVPYQQTLDMAERLKGAGVRYELLVLPGVGHSLIGSTPALTRDANQKALDATVHFLDRTIGPAAKR